MRRFVLAAVAALVAVPVAAAETVYRFQPADQALAKRVGLRQADLPGWKADGMFQTSGKSCRAGGPKRIVVSGRVNSRLLTKGGTGVGAETRVFPTVAAAADVYMHGLVAAEARDCLRDTLLKGMRKNSGSATFGGWTKLPLHPRGLSAVAYRASLVVAGKPFSTDMVMLRKGRAAVFFVTFRVSGGSAQLNEELQTLERVAGRLLSAA